MLFNDRKKGQYANSFIFSYVTTDDVGYWSVDVFFIAGNKRCMFLSSRTELLWVQKSAGWSVENIKRQSFYWLLVNKSL